uniref:Uncharacterized protein n=1 Tax=Triticum urartu TaxID=4572 RepID=A0A8R7USH7_TRIUA
MKLHRSCNEAFAGDAMKLRRRRRARCCHGAALRWLPVLCCSSCRRL